MLEAGRTPENARNRLYFPGTLLRPSEFVWTNGLRGEFNSNAVGGREFARGNSGGGRILEMNVQRDAHGRAPQINNNRPRTLPLQEEEPPPRRRRMNSPNNGRDYRPVPRSPPVDDRPVRVTTMKTDVHFQVTGLCLQSVRLCGGKK